MTRCDEGIVDCRLHYTEATIEDAAKKISNSFWSVLVKNKPFHISGMEK